MAIKSPLIWKLFRSLWLALVLVMISIVGGTIGFRLIEHCSWVDSVYMSIITLSTVGFTEVHDFSPYGRIFLSILIIFNIGVVTIFLSNLIGMIAGGELKRLFNYFITMHKLQKIENHVIVCGLGRYGRQVARELTKTRQTFVAIEMDQENIAKLELPNALILQGDATDENLLEQAGIRKAKSIIISISEDAENAYIVLTARQTNPSIRIISRCLNEKGEKKLMRAGADHVVMPEKIGGFYMASLAQEPETVEFFTLLSNMGGSNKINFEEISCKNLKPELQNKTLDEIRTRYKFDVNIIASHHSGETYNLNPKGDTLIDSQTVLVVLGSTEEVDNMKKLILT